MAAAAVCKESIVETISDIRMKIKEGFELRQVCGESVIVAEGLQTIDFGKLVNLNSTAAFLWTEAKRQGDFTVASLADALCGEYDVDRSVAVSDIKALLDDWKRTGLVEE